MKTLLIAILTVIVLLSASTFAGAGNLEETLKAFLKSNYPWTDIEVSNVTLSGLAPKDSPSEIIVLHRPPGRTAFKLLYADGRTLKATAMVKAFDPVIMSRRQLAKGAVLQKGDVYTTLADAMRIPKGAVRNEAAVIGKPLSRSISANVAITDTMVLESPLVKKGRKVMLIIDTAGLTVKTEGELHQSASVGTQVKVINLASRKMVTGQLVDAQTVKVGL